MRASAPGKLVISGAYAILRGAPAIVTAVNRRVTADSEKASSYEAPEVTEGMKLIGQFGPVGMRPGYDAGELRSEKEKLGLGSSAAICVASLALLRAEQLGNVPPATNSFRDELFELCKKAHRSAQGGGSGIDVAAAVYGGTLWARRNEQPDLPLTLGPLTLPEELQFEVWASVETASTADFVRRLFETAETHPTSFEEIFAQQTEASEACFAAAMASRPIDFVAALRAQHEALFLLGELSSIPIVLPAIHRLHKQLPVQSCFIPSGAGGGDISLYVGATPSTTEFRALAKSVGLRLIPLTLGAPGLTLESSV